jgi:hypothetical protein
MIIILVEVKIVCVFNNLTSKDPHVAGRLAKDSVAPVVTDPFIVEPVLQ